MIEAFCRYTSNLPSPKIYRKWGGIAAVAGALERKVWCTPYGFPLYPNTYVVLVGGPGVGKSITSKIVEKLWRELTNHHVAPSNVTRASLIDTLAASTRQIVRPGCVPSHLEFNALNVAANELGVFIPAWDSDFMNHLTDLWDCGMYQERKRTSNIMLKIEHPVLNIIGCTTPSWLVTTMPAGAWEQGFAARVIFVYSGERIISELHGLRGDNPFNTGQSEMFGHLAEDLKRIGNLVGAVSFDDATINALTAWNRSGGQPCPDHPKLLNYITRRTTHLLKLCMIYSAAKRDDLLVTLEIYQEALDTLLEFEAALPDVFKAMVLGNDAQVTNELQYQLLRMYAAKRQPIEDKFLWEFLRQRLPAHNIERALQSMISGGLITQAVTADGKMGYIPRPKITFD